MRVLITGSRTWNLPADVAEDIVRRMMARSSPSPLTIVHGACETGIDAAFDKAARACGATVERYPADWDDIDHPDAVVRRSRSGRLYNANAGPTRNQKMVDTGGFALCVAFSQDLKASRGTADCVRRALAASIPTYLIADDSATPRRIKTLGV